MAELLRPHTLKQRLISGSAWALTGKVATILVGLIANALLARLLSPRDLGAYFLAVSLVTFGSAVGVLGLNQVVVRLIAESVGLGWFGRARRVVGLACGLGVLGSLGVGLAYLLLGRVVGGGLFGAPALVAVTGLVAGWMAVITLQTLLAEVFRGFHEIRLATVFGGLSTGVLSATALGLVWLFEGGATLGTVVLIASVSGATSAVLAGWLLRRKVATLPAGGEEGRARHGELLGAAWPLLVTNLTLLALTQADLWIIGAFRPEEDAAVYGGAARVVILISMSLLIVNLVVPPLIAEMYAQGRRAELERTLRATATLAGVPALLVLAGFVLLGEPVLGLIYGDNYDYRAGATVLALLSLGHLVNVWAGSCGIVLMMTGHQLLMMAITVVCGMGTIAVGLWVVGPYGPTGVAAAAAAGLALQNVSMWLGARATTGMWTHVRSIGLLTSKRTAGTG